MYRMLIPLLAAGSLLTGCGSPAQNAPAAPSDAAPAPAPAAPAAAEQDDEESGPVTELQAQELGPYKVRAIYTGALEKGHFNFYVTGGDLKALRSWVGDETAAGALVTKANWEEDHYCAHIEMPAAIPADAALWFEIESADGSLKKSSMPLGVR